MYHARPDGNSYVEYASLCQALDSAKTQALTKAEPKIRKPYISDSTWELIKYRESVLQGSRWDPGLVDLNKQIQKAARKDRKKWIVDQIDNNMDEKDFWFGLKQLRTGYKPRVYVRHNKNNQHAAPKDHAAATAEYLATTQWGYTPQEKAFFADNANNRSAPLNQYEFDYNTGDIAMDELDAQLGKLKMAKGQDRTTKTLSCSNTCQK